MAFKIGSVGILGMDGMLETVRVLVIVVQMATVTDWEEEFYDGSCNGNSKKTILQYLIVSNSNIVERSHSSVMVSQCQQENQCQQELLTK